MFDRLPVSLPNMRPQIRDLLRFIIAAGDGALVPGYADVVFVSVVAHEVVLFVGFVVAGGDAAFADYLALGVKRGERSEQRACVLERN